MKKILLIRFFCLAVAAARAQVKITLEDVSGHIGDSVEVCGVMAGGVYLSAAANTPTLLDMGQRFPKQQLSIVIWSDVRKQFAAAPETTLAGKMVCVKGRITMYRNKPQIVLQSAALLAVQE